MFHHQKRKKGEMAKMMVIGGMHVLSSLEEAMEWVEDKLQGFQIMDVYMKGEDFNGLVFVKFHDIFDRNQAAL